MTIIIIIGYILPCIINWRYVHIAHSKGGRCENVDTRFGDFLFCFFPILNLIIALGCLSNPAKKDHKPINFNNFFKLNK